MNSLRFKYNNLDTSRVLPMHSEALILRSKQPFLVLSQRSGAKSVSLWSLYQTFNFPNFNSITQPPKRLTKKVKPIRWDSTMIKSKRLSSRTTSQISKQTFQIKKTSVLKTIAWSSYHTKWLIRSPLVSRFSIQFKAKTPLIKLIAPFHLPDLQLIFRPWSSSQRSSPNGKDSDMFTPIIPQLTSILRLRRSSLSFFEPALWQVQTPGATCPLQASTKVPRQWSKSSNRWDPAC